MNLVTVLNAAAPKRAFLPTHLVGIQAWWDASDANTVAHVSNSVSQWSDKSGSDKHAVQPTGALQPIFGSDATGNYLQFTGPGVAGTPNEYLTFDSINAQTIFFVGEITKTGSNGIFSAIISSNLSGSLSESYIFLVNSANDSYVVSLDGSSSDSGDWYLDGKLEDSGGNIGDPSDLDSATHVHTFAMSSQLTRQQSVIGALGTNGTGLNRGYTGKIRELIVFDGSLTADDQAQVVNYLKSKWSI